MNASIKIGCSAVLSGHEAIHGKAIVNAVAMAVAQANHQIELPFKLELVVGNDRDESKAAIEVARKFIQDGQVLAVVGPMNSEAEFAAGLLYQQANMVHISPAASNQQLTHRGLDTFFRMIAHDEYQGACAAEFASLYLKTKRLGIIHDGSTFGKPLANVFRQRCAQLDADIVVVKEIKRGQQDFLDIVANMAANKPELIFFGVIEAEGLRLAPQLRQAGVGAVFLGTDGLKSSRYLLTPNTTTRGPYYSNASTDINEARSAHAFKKAFVNKYGNTYSVYSAEAYDAAGILIRALTGVRTPTRRSVLEVVARGDAYTGATGKVSFDGNGDRLNPRIGFYEQRPQQTVFLGFDQDILGGQV